MSLLALDIHLNQNVTFRSEQINEEYTTILVGIVIFEYVYTSKYLASENL